MWAASARPASPRPALAAIARTHSRRGPAAAPRASGESGRGFGKDYRIQDEVRLQRQVTLAATDVLARLLQAQAQGGAAAVAEEYVDSLNEEFFQIGGVYLEMAKKEGDAAVTGQLESALRAAMDAKNATLRPEIQLVNKLLAAETDTQRAQALNPAAVGDLLAADNFYVFTLLDRMAGDVAGQPQSKPRDDTLAKIKAARAAAVERLPPAVRLLAPKGSS